MAASPTFRPSAFKSHTQVELDDHYLIALAKQGKKDAYDKIVRRYYDVATLAWLLVLGARFVVLRVLYNLDEVGWLGFARIAMGPPLVAAAFLVTIWAVRKADLRQKQLATNP